MGNATFSPLCSLFFKTTEKYAPFNPTAHCELAIVGTDTVNNEIRFDFNNNGQRKTIMLAKGRPPLTVKFWKTTASFSFI